jgi:hypothetical protein
MFVVFTTDAIFSDNTNALLVRNIVASVFDFDWTFDSNINLVIYMKYKKKNQNKQSKTNAYLLNISLMTIDDSWR